MFTYTFTFCSGLLFFLQLLFGCKMKNDGHITELHIPASFTEQELGGTAPPVGAATYRRCFVNVTTNC